MAKSQLDKNFLLKAGVYIVGGLLIWRAYKNIFGSGALGENAPDAIKCSNIRNSGKLTRDKNAYYADADSIYTAIQGSGLFVSWFEDDDLIEEILKRCNNDFDVSALICAFGNRKPSTLAPAEPLNAYITEYLDSSNRASVNATYAQKGITFRW